MLTDKTIEIVANTFNANLFEDAITHFKSNRKAVQLSHNIVKEPLQQLQNLSRQEKITLAVIGGAATAYHGYPRSTKDIDIVISNEDYAGFLRQCHWYGFKITDYNPTGMSTVTYKNQVPIEILREGMFSPDPNSVKALPNPQALGVQEGMGFASLQTWVRLKLTGDRIQDHADIVNVLKRKSPTEIKQIEDYLTKLDPDLKQQFHRLKIQAEQEQSR